MLLEKEKNANMNLSDYNVGNGSTIVVGSGVVSKTIEGWVVDINHKKGSFTVCPDRTCILNQNLQRVQEELAKSKDELKSLRKGLN